MKILHLADTHLGYSAYRKINKDGINQREVDIYDAFKQVIDYSIKIKPDFIIHAGDLFDSVRPNNRAISVALQEFIRLSNKEIPLIVISGNHETPKLRETGNIFRIFDHLENIYPVYDNKYEILDFKKNNKTISFHALPQFLNKKEFDENLKKVKTKNISDYNFLILHGAVTGMKEFSMNEFNEHIIPKKIINDNFDYIALGHYHKFTKISENTFYSGSSEKLSFSEANEKKGFIEIDLDKEITTKFIELKTRPMIDLKPILCEDLSPEKIMKILSNTLSELDPKNKIIRLRLDKIPNHIYRGLDFNNIRNLTNGSLHFEINTNVIRKEGFEINNSIKIQSLANEFEKYLKTQKIENEKEILALGNKYIQKIESEDEGK